MQKIIFVIAGHTGSGKTSIAKAMGMLHDMPIVSFSKCGKKVAKEKGFQRIREYWNSTSKNSFRKKVSNEIIHEVEENIEQADSLIIEGLYDDNILNILKQKNFHVIIVYLDVSEHTRIMRITKRTGFPINQVLQENKDKEDIKISLGINGIMNAADYIIDGEADFHSVFNTINDIYLQEKEKCKQI